MENFRNARVDGNISSDFYEFIKPAGPTTPASNSPSSSITPEEAVVIAEATPL